MKKTPAIILSAGRSRRMGFPKALLRTGRHTLLEDQISRLKKAGCSPVIAILGAYDLRKMSTKVKFVMNLRWRLGQFSSVKCGLRALGDISRGCIILPVDVPFVPAGIIKRILKTAEEHLPSAVIPRFTDKSSNIARKGHPVWISSALIRQVLRTGSGSGRLDEILSGSKNVLLLDVKSRAILGNVNTRSGLKKGLKEPF